MPAESNWLGLGGRLSLKITAAQREGRGRRPLKLQRQLRKAGNLACKSPADVYGVAYAILREVKDEKMDNGFSWAETLHTESLQDYLLESEIELGIKGVTDFVEGVAACLNVGAASAGKSAD